MKKFIFFFLLLVQTSAFATVSDDPALLIKSIKIQEIEIEEDKVNVELPSVGKNPLEEVIMYIDTLIAFGKKVWPIIEAGKPVINTNGLVPAISILPRIDGDANRSELYRMSNWSRPKSVSYRVIFENMYGNEIIGFNYTVFFQHSGSLNGVGKYVTSLRVQASEVYAAWGFDFDAKSELVNVTNVGTVDEPVAAGIITVSYIGKGIFNEIQASQSFYVDGLGNFNRL